MDFTKSIKIKSLEGKEREYTIYLLGAFEGLGLAKKLSSIILPSIGAFMSGDDVDFMDIADSLVNHIEALDLQGLIDKLLNGVLCDGMEINFDQHFMANYGELTEIIAFALKENFGSFFTSAVSKELKGKVTPQD